MPNRQVNVIGAKGFEPTDEQASRVQTFLKWLPSDAKPDTVILMRPADFRKAADAMSRQGVGGKDTQSAFSYAGRTYLNADLFNKKRAEDLRRAEHADKFTPDNAVEYSLAHESAHMGSKLSPYQQEQHDVLFNEAADKAMQLWNEPQAQAYRRTQELAQKNVNRFDTERPDIPRILIPLDNLVGKDVK